MTKTTKTTSEKPPHTEGRTYRSNPPCRCQACTDEASKTRNMQRLRAIQRQRGAEFPSDKIDAAPYHEMVRHAVRKRKLSMKEVERLCGVGSPAIQTLSKPYTPGRKIYRKTAEKIERGLSDPDARGYAPGSRVPRKKSRQIVRSLCAQGWTTDHQRFIIENNLHTSGFCVVESTYKGLTHISKRSEDKILWLARVIGDKQGPAEVMKKQMRTKGYFPLKHYNVHGDIMMNTLTPEQKEYLRRAEERGSTAA